MEIIGGVGVVRRTKASFIFLNKMFLSVSLFRVRPGGRGVEEWKGCLAEPLPLLSEPRVIPWGLQPSCPLLLSSHPEDEIHAPNSALPRKIQETGLRGRTE